MNGKFMLWLVCILSLLLNAYFIYYNYPASSPAQPLSAPQQALSLPNQVPASLNEQLRPLSQSVQTQNTSFINDINPVPTPSSDREELLHYASALLNKEHYPELRLFLRDYLQQHPLDMDFLLLEARLNVKTELLSDAIAHYYSLSRLPMTAAQNTEVNDRISELSKQTITQLQRAYSWDTLAIFVEPLVQLEPQNRSYILALAEAYAQQSQFNLMENILASLDFNDPGALEIRALALPDQADEENTFADSADPGQTSDKHTATAVPLRETGDQYIVNAQLSDNSVALLLDTGASITALSWRYFKTLDKHHKIHFVGRFSVNTAAGKVLAPMYQFSELRLNHAVVKNISVVVLPLHNMGKVDGLLGMNFLREFDFKIDQRQSRLLLQQ